MAGGLRSLRSVRAGCRRAAGGNEAEAHAEVAHSHGWAGGLVPLPGDLPQGCSGHGGWAPPEHVIQEKEREAEATTPRPGPL